MTTTAEEAQATVLRWLNSPPAEDPDNVAVIQSCKLSRSGDYWIIRANGAGYVLHGKFEHCLVGVNAFMVATATGDLEMVGSTQSVKQYLQDKDDLKAVAGRHYLLGPAFGRQEKTRLMNLRQTLACPLHQAIVLLSAPQDAWFTGRLGSLQTAKELLAQHGIEVTIWLGADLGSAIEIDDKVCSWDALKTAFPRLIHILASGRPGPESLSSLACAEQAAPRRA